jgi:hypothetical protein
VTYALAIAVPVESVGVGEGLADDDVGEGLADDDVGEGLADDGVGEGSVPLVAT